jgi:hypothetical protein
MGTGPDSTNSSTPDTRLQELDRLIALSVQAQEIADAIRAMAEKLAAELGRELQPRLPLGDD